MAHYVSDETKRNPIICARDKGYAAGAAGGSDVVPQDIAQRPLETLAWLRGYRLGRKAYLTEKAML